MAYQYGNAATPYQQPGSPGAQHPYRQVPGGPSGGYQQPPQHVQHHPQHGAPATAGHPLQPTGPKQAPPQAQQARFQPPQQQQAPAQQPPSNGERRARQFLQQVDTGAYLTSIRGTHTGESLERRVQVLNRVGKMLRRKVGHEREDKAFDSMMRAKTLHITIFSMLGLISMIVGGSLTWYTGDFRADTHWKNADPTMKTVMLSIQVILSLSTLVTVFLIMQYYRMLLLSKRSEWSMADDYTEINPDSYSFLQSQALRYGLVGEILVHLVHPVFVMQDVSYSLFTLCQIFMFARLYLFVRILHTFSRSYRLRIEIINSNRDFQTMNLRIKMNLTLKMLFYNRTYVVLALAFFTSISVYSFMIFLVERNEQRHNFGRLENVFWFSFITFTTIGFGDFVPATTPGRAITILLGITGVIVTTVFSGVLTNKLAPTKIQRYVVEYLQVREATDHYRQCAGKLLLAAFRTRVAKKRGMVGAGHKSNLIYGAIKQFRRARFAVRGAVLPSTDPVLEEKMVNLKQYLRSLEAKLSAQQDMMRDLQDKIDYELASILRLLANK